MHQRHTYFIRQRHWWATLLLSGAAAVPASAAYRVDLDAPQSFRSILWEHLDLVRYRNRDDISDDRLDFLATICARQIAELAATEGYFSAVSQVTVGGGAGRRSVHIHVVPGPRTIVSSVNLDLDGAAKQVAPLLAEHLRKSWRLPSGQPFRQAEWERAKEQALQALQSSRFPAARLVDSRARIDAEGHDALLSMQFDSGPAFTLGPLQVTGTQRYPAAIVHHVNPLAVGEAYRADRLQELQRQIQGTPYFSNATVDIDLDPDQSQRTPVRVRVVEYPAQRVRGGAGYASDTGAHIEGIYEHNDVFGRAYSFSGNVKIEQRRQLGALDLALPPKAGNRVDSVHSSTDRTTLQGADLRSLRAGLQRAQHSDRIDTVWTLDYYRDELLRIGGVVSPGQTVVAPGTHRALVPAVSWTRRDVDDLIFPRHGHLLSAQAGMAWQGVLSDQSFVRAYGRARQYLPIGMRDLVIAHAELGAVLSRGSNAAVPASLLFRAGGTDSIRGYGYQSIGNAQNGTVYPTRYVATAGAEYQHWLTVQWGAAVFYDAGTATDNWSRRIMYQAIGAGVRWRSPVGRVQLDLAYGVRTGKLRPHIALGVAF